MSALHSLAQTYRPPGIHFASASFLPSALHLLRSDFSSAPNPLRVGIFSTVGAASASLRLLVRPASASRRLFPPSALHSLAQTSRPPGICFTSAFPTVRPASASHRLLVRPASASRPPLTGPGAESSVCGNHVTNQRKVNKNNTSTRSVRIKNWVFAFFLVTFVTN